MKTRAKWLAVVVFVLLAACGGDDGAADDADGAGDDVGDSTTTTTTTSTTTTTTTTLAAGSGDDFCEFAQENVVDAEISPAVQTPEDLRDAVTGVLSDLQQAAAMAPSEIEDDVNLFVDAYAGLAEFLEEYEWNFFAVPEDALDDPRLNRFDDADIEEAANNIEAYCGFEFIESGPGDTPPPAGPGNGGGPLPGAEIPDDFPEDLIPPDGTVLATVEVGGAQSITLDVESTLDNLVEFYTELLGPPTGTTPDGALWVATFNGTSTTVALAETGPNMVNMNVTFGP